MIQGVVNTRCEATLQLRVRGPAGAELNVDAVIDSGYSGALTLSSARAASLGLPHHSTGGAILGDGSVRRFDVYEAEVEWDGNWLPVLVSAVGNEILVGMRLLAGHKLCMEIVPGGAVEINPLP